MDWQPIRTAPKDGTPIEIAWMPNGVVEHVEHAAWRAGEWRHEDVSLGLEAGFYIDMTHWRPIEP